MENNSNNCWPGQEDQPEWGDSKKITKYENISRCDKEKQIFLEQIKEILPNKFRECIVIHWAQVACHVGDLDVIQFIFSKYDISYFIEPLSNLIKISQENGHLEIVKWLNSKYKDSNN